jgi:hypothetical protein
MREGGRTLLATEQSRMGLQANFLLKSAVVNTSQGRHRAWREWEHLPKAEGEACALCFGLLTWCLLENLALLKFLANSLISWWARLGSNQ